MQKLKFEQLFEERSFGNVDFFYLLVLQTIRLILGKTNPKAIFLAPNFH